MKRDTLLGYGFLLIGLGLAYLLALLVGRALGTIIAVAVVVIGAGFLLFGHTQSGDSAVSASDVKKVLRTLVPSLEIGLALSGLWFVCWTVSSLSQDALTVPATLAKYKPPKPPPIERDGVRQRQIPGLTVPTTAVQQNGQNKLVPVGSVEHTSRIEIIDIQAIDLISSKYPGRTGLGFNILYANRGNSVATEVTHGCTLVTTDHTLNLQEETQLSSTAGEFQPDPDTPSELQPEETPRHYFSCPDEDEGVSVIAGYKSAVLAGRSRLYLFVTVKHRNKYLAPNQIAVTEFCGYFLQTFQMWHACHIGRSYLETVKASAK